VHLCVEYHERSHVKDLDHHGQCFPDHGLLSIAEGSSDPIDSALPAPKPLRLHPRVGLSGTITTGVDLPFKTCAKDLKSLVMVPFHTSRNARPHAHIIHPRFKEDLGLDWDLETEVAMNPRVRERGNVVGQTWLHVVGEGCRSIHPP
jgi:hypothetical protein